MFFVQYFILQSGQVLEGYKELEQEHGAKVVLDIRERIRQKYY